MPFQRMERHDIELCKNGTVLTITLQNFHEFYLKQNLH